MLHISTGADWQHPRFWTGITTPNDGSDTTGVDHPAAGRPGEGESRQAETDQSKVTASSVGGSKDSAVSGASSCTSGPPSPHQGHRGASASLIAIKARNEILTALLASERESAERDRITARNLVQQLREKLEAFQSMAATPSDSAPALAFAATDAQATAIADDGAASAAAARIRFLESQLEAADEALLQSQQALKTHIAAQEAQASAAATEVLSLRMALNRQTAKHDEMMKLAVHKEAMLRQRIDRLEIELIDTKARLSREEAQPAADLCDSSSEKPVSETSRSPSSSFSLSDGHSSSRVKQR